MPRFGFRSGTFHDLTIEDTARELARLGYDCLELCLERPDVRPESLTAERCRELRGRLDEIGIGLASVSYHGDNEEYGQRRLVQERAVEVASWLGAKILVLNAERSSDQPRQWAEHVERFRHLAGAAEQLDVTIAVEPEPLLVVGSSADARDFLAAVGSRHLGVNFDVGHAAVTDPDPAASIGDLGAAIVHLHLEDIRGRVHRHLFFGEGDIDFAAVRAALAEIDYRGPYVADLFGFGDAPSVAAERALAGMRERFS
jgi:sugar phosphate isomerase/epimerase